MKYSTDKFKELFSFLINSFFYMFCRKQLLVYGYVKVKNGKIVKSNWGDDLNVYLLELLTGYNVIVANRSLYHILFKKSGFLCIGSILGFVGNKNSVVWGTGSLGYAQPILSEIPSKICSVRGPMTKELLGSYGYECPEIYGDPALLLSKYYMPSHNKKYRMGIVPHVSQKNEKFINDFADKHEDVVIIDLQSYSLWTDIIDQINSCEFIISSSLHGLIVADSYKIPNVWIKFPLRLAGDNFKFCDYLKSVHREVSLPIEIASVEDLEKIYCRIDIKYEAIIDYNMILESCPFKHLLSSPLY